MNVSIFDNLNIALQNIVSISAEIGTGIKAIPIYISHSFTMLSNINNIFPSELSAFILLVASCGILLKITHYGD